MKIQFERKKLLGTLQKVEKFTDKLNGFIKFTTDTDGKCSLFAYNSRSSITVSIDTTKCDEVGEFLLSRGVITQLLAKIKAQDVTLDIKKSSAKLTAGNSTYKMPLGNLNDWIYPKTTKLNRVCSIMVKDLKELLTFGQICAEPQETYPLYLSSVMLEMQGNSMVVQSTNGRGLAKAENKNVVNELGDNLQFLLPYSLIKTLLETLSTMDEQNEVELYGIVGNQLLFRVVESELEITARLVDSKFPMTQKVLDGLEIVTMAEFPRLELLQAIDRVNIVTRDFMKQALLILGSNLTTIKSIMGDNYNYGMAVEEVSYSEPLDGKTGHIALNSEYVLNALKTFSEDTVIFCISSGGMATISNEERNKLYVLAQINVSDAELEPLLQREKEHELPNNDVSVTSENNITDTKISASDTTKSAEISTYDKSSETQSVGSLREDLGENIQSIQNDQEFMDNLMEEWNDVARKEKEQQERQRSPIPDESFVF